MVEDPQLLKASKRETWRPGSVVEILADSRWTIGFIHSQEQHGYWVVPHTEGNHGTQQTLKFARPPEVQPVGTHVRSPPPGWEVSRGNPPLLHSRRWNSTQTTLEAAWIAHIQFSQKKGIPHQAGRPDTHLGKGSPAASPPHVMHSSARSQALSNGETQAAMSYEELFAKWQECQKELEGKDEKIHRLIQELNNMQTERDEARRELERFQHGVAHRSASQTSLPSAQSMVVSPGLQPSSSAKCIKSDAGLPPVPNSWQPPQSARDGKCLSPASPASGGHEDAEDGGDIYPGPAWRTDGPLATVPQVPAAAPQPMRCGEKPVDILVTVPRASGPEDLDFSNYEHFHKDHRFHEPSRSLQSLQKNMQPPPPHTVTRLPSAPVHSQAYGGQVTFQHMMHPNFRIVTSASASVPSAPASLAAPAGGVRLAPRPSLAQVNVAPGYAVR